jgi:Pyridoxamine 5'-phosphate oxidase
MVTWNELAAAAPDIAGAGERLLRRSEIGEGMLATAAREAPPRLHAVYAEIVDGRLLTFVQAASAKAGDLASDGRYAFHTHIDPVHPDEFAVRGTAREVADEALRARAVEVWAFDATDGYRLFELDIVWALHGSRPTEDDWPPIYRSWRSNAQPKG